MTPAASAIPQSSEDRAPAPRVVVVEPGAIDRIAELLDAAGIGRSNIGMVVGRGPSLTYAYRVRDNLSGASRSLPVMQIANGTRRAASQLADALVRHRCPAVVAIGGGRTIDVAKVAAAATGIGLVSVPTSLPHNGIASPEAFIEDESGRGCLTWTVAPVAVAVDLDVVRTAPSLGLAAGLGDLIGSVTAVQDWRTHALGGGPFDTMAAAMAEGAATSVLDLKDLGDPDNLRRVAEGLILSGIAMSMAGSSRPCSGSEHLVSQGLDLLLGAEARPHGLQVALGTLVAMAAQGTDPTAIWSLFERCGVPTRPEQVGLTVEHVAAAVRLAVSADPERRTAFAGLHDDEAGTRQLVAEAFPSGSDLR